MSTTRYDVLVIGGGPAGSSCAWALKQNGLRVLVWDRKNFPRDKTCAGWVTPPVLDALNFDRNGYQSSRVFQPITGFRTGVIGGSDPVESHYDEPVSFGIRRCEFDHYLLSRSGVDCRLGEPIKSIERTNGIWKVNDEIESPMLVGAGGHFCPVRRKLCNESRGDISVVAAKEIEFEASPQDLNTSRVKAEIPELYFCEDLQGYAWCFRKGNFLNIGLGRIDPQGISAHLDSFLDFLRARRIVAGEIPNRFHGHAYRLYEGAEPFLYDEAVLLVGDAAGLAYPQSGEGIRPAVESGLEAASTIVVAAGDYSREKLARYAEAIIVRLGNPRRRSASDWLPHSWLQFVARRLLSSRWFARHVILDRWFLHAT